MKIPNQKALFSIPDNIAFMNCANMAPHLKSVSEAGYSVVRQRDEPWTITIDQWFKPGEELKKLFATIINCDQGNIALIPSASYGIAVARNNIKLDASHEIIVLDQQFPSNVYAWREFSKETGAKIVTVEKDDKQTWTDAILDSLNDRTGLVAIPNCHWTNGGLIDLVAISEKTKRIGAKLESKVKEITSRLIDNGIIVSFRGASMRIAPHLYNDERDIERLFRFI